MSDGVHGRCLPFARGYNLDNASLHAVRVDGSHKEIKVAEFIKRWLEDWYAMSFLSIIEMIWFDV